MRTGPSTTNPEDHRGSSGSSPQVEPSEINQPTCEHLPQLSDLTCPSKYSCEGDELLVTVKTKLAGLGALVGSWSNVEPAAETSTSMKERFAEHETSFDEFFSALHAVPRQALAHKYLNVSEAGFSDLLDVSGEFHACKEGVLRKGERIMGFPRDAVPNEIWAHVARYVKYLSHHLGSDNLPSLPNVEGTPCISSTFNGAEIIYGILKQGLLSAHYARYLNQTVQRGADERTESGYQIGKPACVCFWSTASIRAEGEDPARYISESSCSFGQHTPLGVSVERPTDDIDEFPGNVTVSEMERRLKLSAIVLLRIDGGLGKRPNELYEIDQVMFRGRDGDAAYMCGPIPPQHIFRIIIPAETAASLSPLLPDAYREKILPVHNSISMPAWRLLHAERSTMLQCPDFQTEVQRCISEAMLAEAHNGNGSDCTIGIHATRLGL